MSACAGREEERARDAAAADDDDDTFLERCVKWRKYAGATGCSLDREELIYCFPILVFALASPSSFASRLIFNVIKWLPDGAARLHAHSEYSCSLLSVSVWFLSGNLAVLGHLVSAIDRELDHIAVGFRRVLLAVVAFVFTAVDATRVGVFAYM